MQSRSWVSIHSEILGQNSAVQSVRRQRRDILTPSVVWASTGIQAHAAANDWVSHPALNPPCHQSTPAARQTESDPACTTFGVRRGEMRGMFCYVCICTWDVSSWEARWCKSGPITETWEQLCYANFQVCVGAGVGNRDPGGCYYERAQPGEDQSGGFHLPDMQNSRYALKSGWPADRIWFSSWPAENIIYQLAVLENYSWQNVHISGWLAADFSPAGRFEEKYAAGSFR